jgi:hypothetical protein
MPTRRTSRRASRSLRSNARPIRLPRKLVDELMSHVSKYLTFFRQRTDLHKPIWKFHEIASDNRKLLAPFRSFSLDSFAGPRRVGVKLTTPDIEQFGVGGQIINKDSVLSHIKFLEETDDPREGLLTRLRADLAELNARNVDALIYVYVHPMERPIAEDEYNPDLLWHHIDSPQFIRGLRLTLEHELTHAMEHFPGYAGMPGIKPFVPSTADPHPMDRLNWERASAYWNAPIELRAHMANLIGEIRSSMKRKLGRLASMNQITPHAITDSLFESLSQTHAWTKMEPYLTDQSRNLLLKGIVTALEDEGIIRIE